MNEKENSNRHNIIWLTLESILPPDTGGRIGIFKRFQEVSKHHNIFLFYPYDDSKEIEYTKDLEKMCKEVHFYSRKENLMSALLNMFQYPYTISSRAIKKMTLDIEKCLNQNEIKMINVDFPHMLVALKGIDNLPPIVLNEHNIEFDVYKSIAKSMPFSLKKWIYYIDSGRLYRYEKKMISMLKIKHFTFVSTKDLRRYKEVFFDENSEYKLIPVGAEKHEINSSTWKGNRILFVGKLSYSPNIEAVKWFVKKVLPLVVEVIPDLTFFVVGKSVSRELLGLESTHIKILGYVDNVKNSYDNTDIVVLPLHNGGGVKVKLLEAVGYRKSVVSTTIGVEGTLYEDGKTLFVADTPTDFANSCIKALLNDEEAQERKMEAYKIFEETYQWCDIVKEYNRYLEGVVDDND